MKNFVKISSAIVFFIILLLSAAKSSYAIEDTLGAAKDNTLYFSPSGGLSNGSGQYFFAGSTASGRLRRGLISFGAGNQIPSGAVVTDVKLILNMSMTISGSMRVKLFKVSKNWGEGSSDATDMGGGSGAASENGDATWIHTFYDQQFWDAEGGDFSETQSAMTNVGAQGFYEWTDAQMVADVQEWVDNPAGEFGWIIVGNEDDAATAKRFDTRENSDPSVRPRLIVTYTLNNVVLNLTAVTQGLQQNYPDTFKVYLRNSFSPYASVDSAVGNHLFQSSFVFNNATSGSYYIVVDQRNSLNTWSNTPQSFTTGVPLNYNFTTAAAQAYGNNLILAGGLYSLYSGDVNKDGFINLFDIVFVFNDAGNFVTGYVPTDVNGDSVVDLTDLTMTFNNSANFIEEERP